MITRVGAGPPRSISGTRVIRAPQGFSCHMPSEARSWGLADGDREDVRQMAEQAREARALVERSPHLATGVAEVDAHRIAVVGCECLPLDRPPRLLAREAFVAALPALATIARHVHRWLAAGRRARPIAGAVH